MTRWMCLALSLGLLSACGRGVPDGARVVVAGDSIMAWNRGSGGSVADVLQQELREPVGDVSLSLARITSGRGAFNIPNQLESVRAQWVVLDGGANDLSGQCECSDCGPVLDRLISEDGKRGAIPSLVADLRARGARVIWADYYTAPRYAGTACEAPYQVLEDRLSRMAGADAGVTLVDLDEAFSPEDPSLFASDRIHPSPKGSALIAAQIAPILR
ncbi:GDSL family lipase [Thioclava dalianensis]|uniref:GDSL family lipase n=2 Tax=Thioclava dalianensis TaxID=1185766 RepID=A0A074TC15_9RHOB|nr:SGNH/GDSL hydrolase family protein [Thioclava dalianensis]KEP69306.1 GDSL family lipase [Thioclava dalianensis]SFN56303.1 Lysophospholipase L1 [Thioclava dalianensis]